MLKASALPGRRFLNFTNSLGVDAFRILESFCLLVKYWFEFTALPSPLQYTLIPERIVRKPEVHKLFLEMVRDERQ